MNGFDSFFEASPKIVVFGCFAHHLQTFKNVYYIIDASAFYFELESNLIKFQKHFSAVLKVLDELPAELLKALVFAVVG